MTKTAPPSEIASLFADQLNLRPSIDAVLEGRHGEATQRGNVARLDIGPFSFLGGDPTDPAARSLVQEIPLPRAVVGTEAWRELTKAVHAERPSMAQPRTRFSPERLDDEHLRSLCQTKGELRAMDAALLDRALREVNEDLRVDSLYPTSAAFFADGGFAFAVLHDGQMVAGAAAAILSSRSIEIQINTAPARQREGWATVVGAALVLEARKRGLDPGWDTAVLASYALAQKLGYVPAEQHVWLNVW